MKSAGLKNTKTRGLPFQVGPQENKKTNDATKNTFFMGWNWDSYNMRGIGKITYGFSAGSRPLQKSGLSDSE
jgi:hypothetical protein